MLKFGTKNAWFECFRPKMLSLGIFGLEFKKNLLSYLKSEHPWICLIAKFCAKTKMSKFQTKNALFKYFSPKIPYLVIFGQEFKKNYC